MAYIRDTNIVDIPPVSQGIPPNPLLGYDGCNTAPPSPATSTSGTIQSTLTHKLLLRDQRCLVTGAVSTQLKACYLINAIHIGKSNREEKLALKKEVERILTRQQFGIGDFFLDSLANCVTMEAQLHGDLNTYSSFCTTLPLAQTAAILTELRDINDKWDVEIKSNPSALRNLDMTKDPFVFREYDLLVLRPDLFLPDNCPLFINTNRALRHPGESCPAQSDRTSWVPFYSNNKPFLTDSSGKEFSGFAFKSLRCPEDSPSVFSLLVNANQKLQSARQKSDNGVIEHYAGVVKATVDAIFYVPKQVQNPAPSLVPPGPSLSSVDYPDIATPGPSAESRGIGGDLQEGCSMRLDSQDGDIVIVGEVHPNLDFDFGDPGYGSEEDDEPDTINGLTFSEMRTVLQRVSDGRISDRERADAAMLMLGMAGGRRRPQALSPLIEDRV